DGAAYPYEWRRGAGLPQVRRAAQPGDRDRGTVARQEPGGRGLLRRVLAVAFPALLLRDGVPAADGAAVQLQRPYRRDVLHLLLRADGDADVLQRDHRLFELLQIEGDGLPARVAGPRREHLPLQVRRVAGFQLV